MPLAKTRWDRLGRFDKPFCVRVRGEERSERLGPARREGRRGAGQRQELFTGADREAVGGMGDNVGVDVVGQVEADSYPPEAGPFRVVVGDGRHIPVMCRSLCVPPGKRMIY
jgi:hypothetical protein